MQMAVIDLATLGLDWRGRDTVSTIEGFDHPWLSDLLRKCTLTHSDEEADYVRVDTTHAETVLVALMQIGREITLDAASVLLNHRWMGQLQLVQFFWSICNELDDEQGACGYRAFARRSFALDEFRTGKRSPATCAPKLGPERGRVASVV